ncbi:MAG: hypothetical protein ACREO5_01860 [Candidatus Binatia bacterium]
MSNHIGVEFKTFGLLPGAMRGLAFDRAVGALILDHSDVPLIVRPMLVAWRQLPAQIVSFDRQGGPAVLAFAGVRVRLAGHCAAIKNIVAFAVGPEADG